MDIPVQIFEAGTILFVDFPYEDSNIFKKRPVIVITNNKKEMLLLCLKMTSHKVRNSEYDYQLKDLSNTGLKGTSVVRCDKGYHLNYGENYSFCGFMNAEDFKEVYLLMSKAIKSKQFNLLHK